MKNSQDCLFYESIFPNITETHHHPTIHDMMIYILTAREIKAMVLCKTAKDIKMVQSRPGSKIPDQLIVNFYLNTG